MESEEISMRKRTGMLLIMLVLIPGMMLMMSCAKKTLHVDPSGYTKADEDEAARMKELERQRAIEEERLKEEALREQEMAKQNARERFINEDVLFNYDESSLTPEAQQILKIKSIYLKENPTVSVIIEGHCDERGTTDYNIALGDRRANSAKLFLMDLGIDSSRMKAVSYGEEKPKDLGHNEAAWTKNRRAHFVIE